MNEWEVTEEAVQSMQQMAKQLDEIREVIQQEYTLLSSSAQEKEHTLGPHSSDIFSLINDIGEINKAADMELSKLSLKMIKAVTIRKSHLRGNKYVANDQKLDKEVVYKSGRTGQWKFTEKDEIIKQIIAKNVQPDILPKNGVWKNSQKPGEGLFVLDDDVQIITSKRGKKEVISGAELKKKYGIEGVYYYHNEPDFSPFVDQKLGIVEVDEIPAFRDGEGGTFDIAMQAVSERTGMSAKEIEEYMIENRLTWHETADRKHIMPVPTEINAGFKHTGGISKEESLQAIRDVWNEKFGGRGISVYQGGGRIVSGTIDSSVIKKYSERKKKNKKIKNKDLKKIRENTPKIKEIVIKR